MKNSLLIAALPAAIIAISATGVAAQSKSIDCSSAKEDIAHLQHEKKSTDERKMKGVLAIMPIGIAINAVSSASSSDKMDIDAYNKKLDERISEIKSTCKV
jgi:hypothetical protein